MSDGADVISVQSEQIKMKASAAIPEDFKPNSTQLYLLACVLFVIKSQATLINNASTQQLQESDLIENIQLSKRMKEKIFAQRH